MEEILLELDGTTSLWHQLIEFLGTYQGFGVIMILLFLLKRPITILLIKISNFLLGKAEDFYNDNDW